MKIAVRHLVLVFTILLLPTQGLPVRAQTAPDTSDLTIEALRKRSYGAGSLRVERTLTENVAFTRSLISYDSDGNTVYGFVNVPKGQGPFPVVLVLHGYVTPSRYRTPLGYTTRYADALARQGFLVIHPDYRAHGRSTGAENSRENLFRVGYAVDVLNLIALAKTLPQADASRIGMIGHSMGSGIALRVMAVNRDVKAAVLYGSMNADEFKNVDQIRDVFRRARSIPEDAVPDERYAAISPSSYLADINAVISIQHGELDAQVPVQWGRDLHRDLSALKKDVVIDVYAGQGHSLQGRALTQMLDRLSAFFKRTLTK
jgi:dipeptidyl aminopeptidase/acylaminoacyl peptidase